MRRPIGGNTTETQELYAVAADTPKSAMWLVKITENRQFSLYRINLVTLG